MNALEPIKEAINILMTPWFSLTAATIFLFAALYWEPLASFMWSKKGLWTMMGGLAALYALGMTDSNFKAIVLKPDNVPITAMIFVFAYFTWYALYQARENDERRAQGKPLREEPAHEKVWVWPDLVYSEFLSTVFCTALLLFWSIGLKAPLEEPADPTLTPNPSKAPWYFLGLQEMLVYYDPWIAGVLLPGLIIVGMMAMPYCDPNRASTGYYSLKERPVATGVFLYGFLVLWCYQIIIGTFLRGPNWNFFGPFEAWDVHKVEALVNVDLSEYVWVWLLGRPLPGHWLVRELPGLLLVGFYFLALPLVLARTVFRGFYLGMGPHRYAVMCFVFLWMLALPIKMYTRWLFNLKYFVGIPEYFFNI
jgi:hypothetical protein